MPRCHCLIRRDAVHYRHDAFDSGLRAVGFDLVDDIVADPRPGDCLVIWNRYGWMHEEALRYEAAGATVLVAENGYLGNDFAGERWYAISKSHHNGAGSFAVGAPDRWDSLGVELSPWRNGREVLVLPQRGIGPDGVRMPDRWRADVESRLAGIPHRVREHPGQGVAVPIEEDLRKVKAVVTWGSGAALKAISLGVPCFHSFPRWIGAGASTPLQWADFDAPQRPAGRLATFQRLAWAMWRLSEIADGTAFRHLCTS